MPRIIKTIKDDNNNDVEVYADNCNVCSKEIFFPKAEADRIHEMFPFIKERAEQGSPCVECAIQQEKNEKKFLFSPEEVQRIKEIIMNSKG